MPTYGIRAYLYKRRYYRAVIRHDAYLGTFGYEYILGIPRSPIALQAWVGSLIEMIEQQVAWRHEHSVPDRISEGGDRFRFSKAYFFGRVTVDGDNEHPLEFEDIVSNLDDGLFSFETFYYYVIDLDNQMFTIGELGNFFLNNLPPDSFFYRYGRRNTVRHPSVLVKYLTDFAHWPARDFDVAHVHEQYAKLHVETLEFSKWGVPDWTTMTVAQQLAAELTQTVLLDHTIIIFSPSFHRSEVEFQNCCWFIMNAAAPGNLCCPVESTQETEQTMVVWRIPGRSENYITRRSWAHPHYLNPKKDWMAPEVVRNHRHYWFRGCLVAFCQQLDAPEHVQYETLEIVHRLRAGGQTTALALAFSGRHVLAVATDGDAVRCSSPIAFHDPKLRLTDGFLLVTHLLSPLSSVNKVPWRRVVECELKVSMARFPTEVVRQIVFSLDDDSHRQLPYVSQLFRQLHSDYPRVLDCHILSRTGKGGYRAYSSRSGATSVLQLQRKLSYTECEDSLAGSFQYVSRGSYNLEVHPEKPELGIVRGIDSEREVKLNLEAGMFHEGAWPMIRVQTVHGAWQFVYGQGTESNFTKSSIPEATSAEQAEPELDSQEYPYALV